MPTLNKRDLAKILAEELGLKKTLAYRCVDVFFQALADAIIRGDRIEIRGLGSWRVKEMKPKPNARNPMTGEQVSVPARRKVTFRPGKILKKDALSLKMKA